MSPARTDSISALADAPPSPLVAVTSELVDANDRLLGLIGLTAVTGDSLDESHSVTALLEHAVVMLEADAAELQGVQTHRVGRARASAEHTAEAIRHDGDQELVLRVERNARPFGTPDRKLLDGVANLAANAVRTARMHQTGLHQAVVAQEHAAAARLTTAVLPDAADAPRRPGIETFAQLTPARTTGGDLYAWDLIDGDLWFAVGDVSGKGLPAAVQMTTIMSAITAGFVRHREHGVRGVFEFVDRMVYANLSDAGMFVTLLLGRVRERSSGENHFTIELANAGHSPVVFGAAGSSQRVAATAPPIGVLAGQCPTVERLLVDQPAALVIATDGFTEQENTDGQPFGEERFDRLVSECAGAEAHAIGTSLFSHLDLHTEDCVQSDDRTLVVMSFEP